MVHFEVFEVNFKILQVFNLLSFVSLFFNRNLEKRIENRTTQDIIGAFERIIRV